MCEFEAYRINLNLDKCYIITKVLLCLTCFLLIADFTLFLPKRNEFPQYLLLFYSHILIILILTAWNYFYKKIIKSLETIVAFKILYFVFIFLIFFWSIYSSLILVLVTKQISTYIITTIALSTFIQLNKRESLIVLILTSLIFTISLIICISDSIVLNDHLINIFCTNIVAFVILSLNYNYSKSYFFKNDELQKSKYALEQINLELKKYDENRTKLFTNISHELKTPINVIYGAHQLLDMQLNNNITDIDKCKNYNSMIKQNSFRLIRLINNLLDMSKIDDTVYEIKRENIDIVQAVESIIFSVSEFIKEKGISIIFDTDMEEKIIAVDPDKLERIILNLISNAIKFTDGGGTIFVNIYTNPKYVYISVKDTGIGIDEAHQQIIFDRFAQIDDSLSRNAEGTGIGLTLVKSLMQLHGGDVTLTSSPGNGSDFTLRFPNEQLSLNENLNKTDYKTKSYKNKIERIEIEFSDIYK